MVTYVMTCMLFACILAANLCARKIIEDGFAKYEKILEDNAARREIFRIRDEDPNVYILGYMVVRFHDYPDPKNPV